MTQKLLEAKRPARLAANRLCALALLGALSCGAGFSQSASPSTSTCPSPANKSLECKVLVNGDKGETTCDEKVIVSDCSGGQQPNYQCAADSKVVTCCNEQLVNYGLSVLPCNGGCGTKQVSQRQFPSAGDRHAPGTLGSMVSAVMPPKSVPPAHERSADALGSRLLAVVRAGSQGRARPASSGSACWDSSRGPNVSTTRR